MGFKYLNNIPFVYITSGTVENLAPLDGSYNRPISDFMQATGLSLSQVYSLFGGNNALYQIYQNGSRLDVIPYGSLQTSGLLVEYTSTGMYNTASGGRLNDYNGNVLLSWVNTFTAGIYYPASGTNYSGIAQYLLVGVVDSNNHISFVTIEGSPTSEISDSDFRWIGTPGEITLRVSANQIYNIFENADWTDAPEPEGGNLGMFDLSNRYSPRTGDKGLGMYVMDKQTLNLFMDDLWDTSIIEEYNYKIFGNPLDSILSLKWFYGIKNDIQYTEIRPALRLGNISFPNIISDVASSEYVTHDFGKVNLATLLSSSGRLTNSFLDYMPYVDMQLYLPYYGFVSINPNEVINGIVGIKLNINLLTGQGLYVIYTEGNRYHEGLAGGREDNHVILTVPCTMCVEIPVNINAMASLGNMMAQTITTAVGVAGGAALMMATGGGGAALLGGAAAASAGTASAAGAAAAEGGAGLFNPVIGAGLISNGAQGVTDALSQPANHPKGVGAFNPDTGSLGSLVPYFYITLPIVATPTGFTDICGNKAVVIDSLDNCEGFTEIVGISPDTVDVSHKYQREITSLLQAGVYL